MARDDSGSGVLLLLIAGAIYYLYTRSTGQGITYQTYASAPATPSSQVFVGPPSPDGTTGSTTAPTDIGGIVMGPGY